LGALSQVGWGIWGTGAIAREVASDFPMVPGARLQAVASRTLAHAQQFALRHGVPRSSAGLDSLLSDPSVDVIYIATPHTRHAQDALACIQAGKAVLCEKPFTVNAAQAERVVDAARERGVFCMEAMWTRFIPAVVSARDRVRGGSLGAVRLIQGNFAYPAVFDPNGRLFDRALAGGALLDRGVYLVSMCQHLLGSPLSVHGSALLGTSGVDEQSAYHLTHQDGSLANLSASIRVQGSNDFQIFGERGSLRLVEPFYRAHRLELSVARAPASAPHASTAQGFATRIKQGLRGSATLKGLRRRGHWLEHLRPKAGISLPFPGNGYQFEIAEVTRCLQHGLLESPTMPLGESINVMRTMDTLRRQWGLVYPQE
jgi:predicted dehydrogenase